MSSSTNKLQTSSASSHTERRSEPRNTIYQPSLVHIDDNESFTTIIDISKKGIGIISSIPAERDQAFKITFINDHNQSVRATVMAKHCESNNHEFYIGAQFESTFSQHNLTNTSNA
jgi:hypothetical protein